MCGGSNNDRRCIPESMKGADCRFGRRVTIDERRFNDKIIAMAMKTTPVQLLGIGIIDEESAVFVMGKQIMKYFFRRNAECKKHEHKAAQNIFYDGFPVQNIFATMMQI